VAQFFGKLGREKIDIHIYWTSSPLGRKGRLARWSFFGMPTRQDASRGNVGGAVAISCSGLKGKGQQVRFTALHIFICATNLPLMAVVVFILTKGPNR
jgi:hypothetical protein